MLVCNRNHTYISLGLILNISNSTHSFEVKVSNGQCCHTTCQCCHNRERDCTDRDCTDIHTFNRFLKERISSKLTKSYVCFNSPSTPNETWPWKCTQRHETCQYIRDCTDRCENDTQFLTHLCDIKSVGCK